MPSWSEWRSSPRHSASRARRPNEFDFAFASDSIRREQVDAMEFDRRAFLAAAAASVATAGRVRAAAGPVLRPEDFGAGGDGVTNDSRAFAALSAEVNRRGGGTISLGAKRTYIVGALNLETKSGWVPAPVLELHDLTAPLNIAGNGARLRCQSGLRFGTFDPSTGQPVR